MTDKSVTTMRALLSWGIRVGLLAVGFEGFRVFVPHALSFRSGPNQLTSCDFVVKGTPASVSSAARFIYAIVFPRLHSGGVPHHHLKHTFTLVSVAGGAVVGVQCGVRARGGHKVSGGRLCCD